MTHGLDTASSLRRLLRMIPPPPKPFEVRGKLASISSTGGKPGAFPPDYLALVKEYGSGEFRTEGDVSMIASVHNPFAPAYSAFIKKEHESLREYKVQEGGGYSSYEIYPVSPGLLQWGWAEGRKAFFWLTEGAPSEWPIIIMWDFEFLARYEMPLVVFFEKLLGGDMECRFLGDETKPIRLDPSRITFLPRAMRRG